MKNPPPIVEEEEGDGKGKYLMNLLSVRVRILNVFFFFLVVLVVLVLKQKGKGGKKDDKKKDAKKDDKKKGKGEEEEAKEVPPPLTGPSQLSMLMHAAIKSEFLFFYLFFFFSFFSMTLTFLFPPLPSCVLSVTSAKSA